MIDPTPRDKARLHRIQSREPHPTEIPAEPRPEPEVEGSAMRGILIATMLVVATVGLAWVVFHG